MDEPLGVRAMSSLGETMDLIQDIIVMPQITREMSYRQTQNQQPA